MPFSSQVLYHGLQHVRTFTGGRQPDTSPGRVGVPQVHLPHVHITFVRAYNADGDARAHGHTDVQETGFDTQKVLRLLSTARLTCAVHIILQKELYIHIQICFVCWYRD